MRDGRGERITKDIYSERILPDYLDCGGTFLTQTKGHYQRCSLGHIHCTHCKQIARRFLKGLTCGGCR